MRGPFQRHHLVSSRSPHESIEIRIIVDMKCRQYRRQQTGEAGRLDPVREIQVIEKQ